ncbi:MAG TPA: tetratricopeptide repeat protein [Oligoflexia bacterium]|nr:tetratricopeptide repeat protein [Oligoflexia bacterium]
MADGTLLNLSHRQGAKLLEEAVSLLHQGLLKPAKNKLELALRWQPSAEAYTHLAWVLSFEHKYQDAIALCEKAVELDCEFGNAYNDIGMYYMKLGDLDAAEPWLEKAKKAARYDKRQTPYLNMGRIFLSRCQFSEALAEFEEALKYEPENIELRTVVERIRLKHPR